MLYRGQFRKGHPLLTLQCLHTTRDEITNDRFLSLWLKGGVKVCPTFIEPNGNLESRMSYDQVGIFVDRDRIMFRGNVLHHDIVAVSAGHIVRECNLVHPIWTILL